MAAGVLSMTLTSCFFDVDAYDRFRMNKEDLALLEEAEKAEKAEKEKLRRKERR